ncbi:MAG: response regulator transcription factor [Chloroflexia bacterium]|nr:response regulator transcription factor [Chloroflexia bacterium]
MTRVLVVEDDPAIADLVRLYVAHAGWEPDLVGDGAEALRRWEANAAAYDLVVLDLMLPGLDGRGLCRRIRDGLGGKPDVPILMLTALDDRRDTLEGFALGADDYLTKPFDPDELVARLKALLRRAGAGVENRPSGERARGEVRRLGRSTLDLAARRLTVGSAEVPLRPREFDLLVALAARPGVVCSRDFLLERVWDNEPGEETRTVDVHVSRLRDRLAAAGSGVSIETVRGIGYRLTVAAD